MQRDTVQDASTIERLSSRPDGWRRAQWTSGAFETAYRPMTTIVEGRILSPNHLIMATLSGGARRHEISADGGHRYDGPDFPSTVSLLPAGCERRLRLHDVEWRWAAIALHPAKISALACASIEALGPLSGAEDSFIWNMLAEFERLDALEGGLRLHLLRHHEPCSRSVSCTPIRRCESEGYMDQAAGMAIASGHRIHRRAFERADSGGGSR